jgi:superoxide dismutase
LIEELVRDRPVSSENQFIPIHRLCTEEDLMSFKLPDLPYAHDALAPYMSRETLEYHHDKHHKAYVDNGNKLLEGSGLENKSLEDVVKGSFGKNAGLFNKSTAISAVSSR